MPRGKKFPIEVMLRAMREVDNGVPVSVVCRKVGMVEKTFYRYREKYAGDVVGRAFSASLTSLIGMPVCLVRRLAIMLRQSGERCGTMTNAIPSWRTGDRASS